MERIVDLEISNTINELYANNCSKLYQMCNKEISKFGGISQKDYDDFYSRVGLEISQAMGKFDPSKGKSFMEYVSGIVRFSVWKEMTDRNREKRCNAIQIEETDDNGNLVTRKEFLRDVSIDAPIGDDENSTIGDLIADDSTIENELFEKENMGEWRKEVVEYLKSLSPLQRKIAFLLSDNNTPNEICEELHITLKHFKNSMKRILADEKIKSLRPLLERM